ncbi:hypothetical protein E1B28_003425 [Marasmius oreades]|uniref:CCAAT-binding factor domain-containing protein n=1 Tax=Marasmius oreades TaxID=181124 RepID=A0A9P7UME8_9AGAR|nr:uncharacterized protein E1B28_003425 [Marasmius oreades]KAG7085891.1 hypothetical protein E1B28_003425 [Marasmius oreades]
MGRIHKEKGGKVQLRSKEKPTGKKSKNNDVLKSQISLLGGNEEDYSLVKDADENAAAAGTNSVDPTLTKDISQFLKSLNFDVPEASGSSSKSKNSTRNISQGQAKKLSRQTDEPTVSEKGKDVATEKSGKGKKSKKPARENDKSTPSKSSKQEGKAVEHETEASKVELPKQVSFNSKSTFVVQPTVQWYKAIPPLKSTNKSPPPLTSTDLPSLSSKASQLHTADIDMFRSSSNSSSHTEASFLSKIIQSGTLSDRLSALTLLVQSSPIHNTKALETLRGMAERGKGKGGREESLKALRCIVDWWVGGGAPDRKLKYFRDQPLTHPSVTDQHLLLWHFEDWLKKYFFSVLQVLEQFSLDPLPYVRIQTMSLIFTLLRDKPEQEQNLLRLLVNKLGDTEKSVCSRASYHILQLLQTHPSMKGVVVREIVALVLRPAAPTAAATVLAAAEAVAAGVASLPANVANRKIKFSDDSAPSTSASGTSTKGKGKSTVPEKKPTNVHARYYATITFNQIVLTPGDRDVALKLIDLYFELFKELLGEDRGSEADGTEDAKPEGKGKDKEVMKDKKGRVMNGKRGKKGKGNAGSKGAAGFEEIEDENSKMISAILTGVNRSLPFAKIDTNDAGFMKHIDTLFMITHTSTFNISLQALVLLQQISSSMTSTSSSSPASKSIIDRYYRTLYASLHDMRLATSSKQAMYLNLLFKSIKADAGNTDNNGRIKAFVRRFVQLLVTGGNGATEFVAGGLYLLGELFSTVPGVRSMINDPQKSAAEPYDPRKRDPQFAHASSSPLWELTPLLNHYHPTVCLHARQLLTSQPLTASADLSLNTLSHFLDRFVYKNPKKVSAEVNGTKGKGSSAMQPAGSAVEGVKLVKGETGTSGEMPMNEEQFLRKRVEDVPADQLFFHKFFTRKREREQVSKSRGGKGGVDSEIDGASDEEGDEESGKEEEMDLTGDEMERSDKKPSKKKVHDDDDEDEDSDAEEEEIWKVMKASMPKAEGDDDLLDDSEIDDDDEIPSGLDADSDEDAADDSGPSDDDEDGEELVDADENLSLAELSDNEDLVALDDIQGLVEYDGSGSEREKEEWGGIGSDSTKRKRKTEEKGRKRKKLRSLPTFASYEEYAKMIEDGPEDDI